MKKTGKEALLAWCKQKTQGYAGVEVQNFSASWRDGLAMCALVHSIRPSLIAWDSLNRSNEIENLNIAFAAAEKIGVPRLLDAEDMSPGPPEPFSMITYLSTLFHAASKIEPSTQASTTSARPAEPERPKATAAVTASSNPTQRTPASSTASPAKSTAAEPPASASAQIKGAPCHKCGKAASGMMVDWGDNLFHQECFKCAGCNRPFRKTCLNIDGLPYCDGCGRKAFVQSRLLRHGMASASDSPSRSPNESSPSEPTSNNSNTPSTTTSSTAKPTTLAPTAAAAKTSSTTPARTSIGASSASSATTQANNKSPTSSVSSGTSTTTTSAATSANRSPSASISTTASTPSVKPTTATTATSSTLSTTSTATTNRPAANSISVKPTASSAVSSTTTSTAKPTSSISTNSSTSTTTTSATKASPAGSSFSASSASTASTSASTAKSTTQVTTTSAVSPSSASGAIGANKSGSTSTPQISISPAASTASSAKSTASSDALPSKTTNTSTSSPSVSSTQRGSSISVSYSAKVSAASATSPPPKGESIVERELREQREKEEELQAARDRATAARNSSSPSAKAASSSVAASSTQSSLKPTTSGRTIGKSVSLNSPTKEVPAEPTKVEPKVSAAAKPTSSISKPTSPPPGESIIEKEMREQREKEAELAEQRKSAKPTAVVTPAPSSASTAKEQEKPVVSRGVKADEERARVEQMEREFLSSSAKKNGGSLPGPSKATTDGRPRLVSAMPNLYAPKTQTASLATNTKETASSTSTAPTASPASTTSSGTASTIAVTPSNSASSAVSTKEAETSVSPEKQALGRIRATTAASSAASISQVPPPTSPMDSMPPRASIFIQETPAPTTTVQTKSPPVASPPTSPRDAASATPSSPRSESIPSATPARPSLPPPEGWSAQKSEDLDASGLPVMPATAAASSSNGNLDIDAIILAARSTSAPVVANSVSSATTASSSNESGDRAAMEYADDDVIEPAIGEEDEEMTRTMRRATTALRRVNVTKVTEGHQGWLKRRDRTATIKLFWTSLWFSLKDSRLLYYKEAPGKNTFAAENLPDGFLSLQFIESIRLSSSSDKKFVVEGPSVKWDLKCSSKEEAADWVEALTDAVTIHNLTERHRRTSLPVFGQDHAEDMIMEGTLNRHTTFGWQSNYWLLQDGMLFYFASQGGKRLGRIPLYHCEFAPYEMSSSKDAAIRAFCITTYQGESIILAAKDEMQMHRWLNCMLRQRIVIEEAIDMISF